MYDVDLRELVLDISGQDIMTADKVTLRINDEPAAIQHEIVRARPRNRIKITLQTTLQVQHPIDLWIE